MTDNLELLYYNITIRIIRISSYIQPIFNIIVRIFTCLKKNPFHRINPSLSPSFIVLNFLYEHFCVWCYVSQCLPSKMVYSIITHCSIQGRVCCFLLKHLLVDYSLPLFLVLPYLSLSLVLFVMSDLLNSEALRTDIRTEYKDKCEIESLSTLCSVAALSFTCLCETH